MGKQHRSVLQRCSAVGVGVLFAGSMWTGTAMADSTTPTPTPSGSATTTATGGSPTCTAALFGQFASAQALLAQLNAQAAALPLGSVIPTALQDQINAAAAQFTSLLNQLSGCAATPASNTLPPAGLPKYGEHGPAGFCPGDDKHGKGDRKGGPDGAPMGGGGSTSVGTSTPTTSSTGVPTSIPTSIPTGVPTGTSGTSSTTPTTEAAGGGTNPLTGAGLKAPAAASASDPLGTSTQADQSAAQPQAAAGQYSAAQPQAAPQYSASQSGGQAYGANQFGPAQYGTPPMPGASAPSYYGTGYPYNTYFYDEYQHGGPGGKGGPDCYGSGSKPSDDHGSGSKGDQVSNVPSGSVNTGDGSTVVVGRTDG